MKASEFILELQNAINEHGDLTIVSQDIEETNELDFNCIRCDACSYHSVNNGYISITNGEKVLII